MIGRNDGSSSYDAYGTIRSGREVYDLDHRASFMEIFRFVSPQLFPGHEEDECRLHDEDEARGASDDDILRRRRRRKQRELAKNVVEGKFYRSYRRRLFLFLTEPSSSYGSAVFFFLLVIGIFASNLIAVLETTEGFQYRPETCGFCDADVPGGFHDTLEEHGATGEVDCVCPMEPDPVLETAFEWILGFFAVEWTVRVLAFVPARPRPTMAGKLRARWGFLCSPTTLLDALAIWPYFIQRGMAFASLRQLWLCRVFQLLRLGSYNSMFLSLTSVLHRSIGFLKLLVVVLFFGATIFGSLIFWMERGEWRYWPDTGGFHYIRTGIDGVTEEISPFDSITKSFWWFIVTATTVGYGDMVPTSTGGQWVGAAAMLTGVLVIAFPVSIFSDLWQDELKEMKELESVLGSCSSHSSAAADRRHTSDLTLIVENGPNNGTVAMEREDVREVLSSLRAIERHQRGIQRILEKYDLVSEDNDDEP